MSSGKSGPLHLLVVDDDEHFRIWMREGLEASGMRCTLAADASAALAALDVRDRPKFDAILMDVMMPGASGWDLLEAVRERTDKPVLFVTARESVDERVRGLRLGADDYIIKPFALGELVARIEAVVRRRRQSNELHASDMLLNLASRRVIIRDRQVDLSPTEFTLLRVLVEGRDRVVSRQELLREVWQTDVDPETNVIDVNVGRLRRKLELAGGPWLHTVRGKGYTFAKDVQ